MLPFYGLVSVVVTLGIGLGQDLWLARLELKLSVRD